MLSMILPVLLGVGLGAAMGYFGQCTSGTCPLTSTWWRGAIYGGVMGLIFAGFSHTSGRTGVDPSNSPAPSGSPGNAIAQVSAQDFDGEVLQSKLPVLVDFYAPWCGPCKVMAPVLEVLSRKFDGRIKFLKVNVDEASVLADRFKIRGVPTLLFFNEGLSQDQIVGLVSEEELQKRLEVLAGPKNTSQSAGI